MKPVLTNQGGQCVAFPDTCKTPTPGGPVPIPYPNIIQCSDGSGSSKVKVKNKQTLRKGDTFRMSSGDEAGSAGGGVVSNKIKGQGEVKEGYSKVKVEGKDVAHLLVTIGQNGGSGKTAPGGKAVVPGQTKVVIMTVRAHGKQPVATKVRTYNPGETKHAANDAMKDAAKDRAAATTKKARVKAGKELGDAGAENAARTMAPGATIQSFNGPGTADLIAFGKKVIHVIEAKGGASPLGLAKFAGSYCRQGTPQYLKGIAEKMANSPNPAKSAAGEKLLDAIKKGDPPVKYCEARTEGDPPETTVKEFDP